MEWILVNRGSNKFVLVKFLIYEKMWIYSKFIFRPFRKKSVFSFRFLILPAIFGQIYDMDLWYKRFQEAILSHVLTRESKCYDFIKIINLQLFSSLHVDIQKFGPVLDLLKHVFLVALFFITLIFLFVRKFISKALQRGRWYRLPKGENFSPLPRLISPNFAKTSSHEIQLPNVHPSNTAPVYQT